MSVTSPHPIVQRVSEVCENEKVTIRRKYIIPPSASMEKFSHFLCRLLPNFRLKAFISERSFHFLCSVSISPLSCRGYVDHVTTARSLESRLNHGKANLSIHHSITTAFSVQVYSVVLYYLSVLPFRFFCKTLSFQS